MQAGPGRRYRPRGTASRSSPAARRAAVAQLTSSCALWPTSPMSRSPVPRSKVKRHGFASVGRHARAERVAGRRGAGARRCGGSCRARSRGSLRTSGVLPPSPVLTYRNPSGPNWSWPPLWFEAVVCGIEWTSRAVVGSATLGSVADRWNSTTWRALPSARGQEHVEAAAGRVVGRERDRQQAFLATAVRPTRHVEEGAAARDLDQPALLDDEHARVVGRRGDVDRCVEPADLDELRRCGGGGRGQQQERHGRQPGAHQWSATSPSGGSSGRPRSCQAVMPPSIEWASYPARRKALAAIPERAPMRQ